ncbi:OTU domain-containing protein 3 [Xylographa trunciseda]|nr:OTU domain-containing protein 3 [Xylographa trunciseda]
MGHPENEFPALRALGLYAGDTTGYGDCLFRALSDQLYGDESHHYEIRARVVQHMRENAHIYRDFTAIDAGGAIRRNPRRAAASYGTVSSEIPSEQEIDRRFRDNLDEMAKLGTYADHLEIQAFCETYGVDVQIYQKESGGMTVEASRIMEEKKPLVLLAYHDYEHYSTIRSLSTPHTGIISTGSDTTDEYTSASDSQQSSAGGVCLQRLQRLRLSQPKPRPLSLTMKDRRKYRGRPRKAVLRSRVPSERMMAGFEAVRV